MHALTIGSCPRQILHSRRLFLPVRGEVHPQRLSIRAMAKPGYEAAVKGWNHGKERGDCPFCQRALLTLQEKGLPYQEQYIDFANKPQWLLDVNPEGTTPAVKDVETGEWFTDSGKFVDYLEDKHPQPQLGRTSDVPEAGSKVFPAFVALIKSTADEQKKAAALANEFEQLNDHLESNGPFIKGKDISAGDLALAPKLHHVKLAGKKFKNFEIPSQLKAVHSYIQTMESRPSWQKTSYPEEAVLAGWESKVGTG